MDTLSPPNGTRSYHNYRDHVVKKVPENKVIISTAETDRRSPAHSRIWLNSYQTVSNSIFFQIMLILAHLPRSSNAKDTGPRWTIASASFSSLLASVHPMMTIPSGGKKGHQRTHPEFIQADHCWWYWFRPGGVTLTLLLERILLER